MSQVGEITSSQNIVDEAVTCRRTTTLRILRAALITESIATSALHLVTTLLLDDTSFAALADANVGFANEFHGGLNKEMHKRDQFHTSDQSRGIEF